MHHYEPVALDTKYRRVQCAGEIALPLCVDVLIANLHRRWSALAGWQCSMLERSISSCNGQPWRGPKTTMPWGCFTWQLSWQSTRTCKYKYIEMLSVHQYVLLVVKCSLNLTAIYILYSSYQFSQPTSLYCHLAWGGWTMLDAVNPPARVGPWCLHHDVLVAPLVVSQARDAFGDFWWHWSDQNQLH